MTDDHDRRRLERLARRAKALDNMILKAAQMQKKIVTEIKNIGLGDKLARRQPMTKARRRRSSGRRRP